MKDRNIVSNNNVSNGEKWDRKYDMSRGSGVDSMDNNIVSVIDRRKLYSIEGDRVMRVGVIDVIE